MIRFDHVSKQYGSDASALTDVNVEIADGEFVFLIGPSGAGKSTFLRLILRDILPSGGSIRVDDVEVNTIPHNKVHLLRRNVGMVFQDFKLLSDRTIAENIALGLEVLGKGRHEIDERVGAVLGLVGLTGKEAYFPSQLSAGESQRASIARAIIGGPRILLADEPTGNLDPDTAWDILDILGEVNRMGTTVIMATHNAAFVDQLKKRTITIRGGAVESDEAKGKYHATKRKHAHKHEETGEKGHEKD